METVACFDIGGTNVKYGLLDLNGNILEKNIFKSNVNNGKDVINNICDIIDKFKLTNNVVGISISSPGFVNTESGEIVDGTIIDGFIGFNIKNFFEDKFNLPVAVDNDANCATIAEHKLGNGVGCKNLACVTIGTGIGGGIIINNEIYSGSRFMAGEFGFMFINGTTYTNAEEHVYSNYASTRALIEKTSKDLNEEINGEEIFKRAKLGDEACKKHVNDFYDNLSIGIYNLSYILNPEKILIGGAVSQQEDLIDEIKIRLDKYSPSFAKSLNEYVSIEKCKFLNDAGLIGSLCNFTTRFR